MSAARNACTLRSSKRRFGVLYDFKVLGRRFLVAVRRYIGSSAFCVVEGAGAVRDAEGGEGLGHERIGEPVVADEPGGDDLPLSGGTGDGAGAGAVLAGLAAGIAVRVVAVPRVSRRSAASVSAAPSSATASCGPLAGMHTETSQPYLPRRIAVLAALRLKAALALTPKRGGTLLGGCAGAVQDACGGADVHVERDADVGVAAAARQPGRDVVQAAPAPRHRRDAPVLTAPNEQITVLEGQVDTHFSPHPDAEIILSRTGTGRRTRPPVTSSGSRPTTARTRGPAG